MDVSSLNTFLVSLRPSIRRSILYLCRKNTRRIRELHAKKVANEQQRGKNTRKASRLTQEIEFVRKSDINDMARRLIKSITNTF